MNIGIEGVDNKSRDAYYIRYIINFFFSPLSHLISN